MPGPLAFYQQRIAGGGLAIDPAQVNAINALEKRFQVLKKRQNKRRWWSSVPDMPKGIYLVGPVGRGKTLLMDLFAQALKTQEIPTIRIHFHAFMANIADQLQAQIGQANPLERIAAQIAKTHRVLCLDEFHVEDIGDAMILGELLRALFEQNVMLVATSNTPPDELYADGLQRARFLPAIEQIKAHTQLIELNGQADHRLRALTKAPTYFFPLDEATNARMQERFATLSGTTASAGMVAVQGRDIEAKGLSQSVVWFDFDQICRTARSSLDFIELVNRFETIMISEIPTLARDDNDAAKRFIHLVDEAYDQRCKLIISAVEKPEALYQGTRLNKTFERTASRLIEMQSHDYLTNR